MAERVRITGGNINGVDNEGRDAQGSEPMGSVEFNAPFSDGLTIETAGSVPVTVIYE